MKKLIMPIILTVVLVINVTLIYLLFKGSNDDNSSNGSNQNQHYNNVSLSDTEQPDDDLKTQSDPNNLEMPLPSAEFYSIGSVSSLTGNLAANICNGGLAVQSLNTIYYVDDLNTNFLLNTDTTKNNYNTLHSNQVCSVNFYKKTLYYIDITDNCICSMSNIKGKKSVKLGGENPYQMIVENDFIYYISAENGNTSGTLHRMTLDGKDDIQFTDSTCKLCNIAPCGDYIFAIRINSSDSSIIAVNSKDASLSVLFTGNVSDLNCIDGGIWFVRHNGETDEICMVEKEQTEIKKIYSSVNISNLIVDDNTAYFISNDGLPTLMQYSVNKKQVETIYNDVNDPVKKINISSEFIILEIENQESLQRITKGKKNVRPFPVRK